jgi:hypothetical protein
VRRTWAHWQVKKLTYFALKAAIFPAVCVMEVGTDAARARALAPYPPPAPSHAARAPFPFLALSHSTFPPRSRSQVGGAEYEGQPVGMASFQNDLVKDQWPDLKATTPNGQLPTCTLEDGSVIPESGAIMRACAAQTGLLGTGKDFVISEMLIGMTGDLVKDTFGRLPLGCNSLRMLCRALTLVARTHNSFLSFLSLPPPHSAARSLRPLRLTISSRRRRRRSSTR